MKNTVTNFILIISILLSSCKENNETKVLLAKGENITLRIAEQWVSNNMKNINGEYKVFDWTKATEQKSFESNNTIVIVPMFTSIDKITIENVNRDREQLYANRKSSNSFVYLMIFKESNGEINSKILTLLSKVPDSYEDGSLLTKFTGIIVLKELSGENISYENVVEGKRNTIMSAKVNTFSLCEFIYYRFTITTGNNLSEGAMITRYTETGYFPCPGSIQPLGGGATSTLPSVESLTNTYNSSFVKDFEDSKDVIGKYPILNPCQQQTYYEYLSTAAGIENDYQAAKINCLLSTYGAAGPGIVAYASATPLKSFYKWLKGKPSGASVRSFMGSLGVTNLVAVACVETALNNANNKINTAYNSFVYKYNNCK